MMFFLDIHVICSQQANYLTLVSTQCSPRYSSRSRLKWKRYKKTWISKGISLQNAWQLARLRKRSLKRNKLRYNASLVHNRSEHDIPPLNHGRIYTAKNFLQDYPIHLSWGVEAVTV